MKLSIIVGYRNRDLERVERYLDSLKKQTVQDFELLFVDYGSDLEVADQVKELTESFDFSQYIYNDTRGWPWNRSHALNTGLRQARGEYILFSDIDLIYSNNFIESVLPRLKPNIQFFKRFYLLPQSFFNWDNISGKLNFSISAINTKGAIHIVEKNKLFEINGFDEFYCFWGLEDLDLDLRLNKLGVGEEWLLTDDAPVFHQWHPIVSNENPFLFPDKWYEQMLIYYQLNNSKILRNFDSWGKIVNCNDRPLFGKTKRVEFKLPESIVLNSKADFITDMIDNLKRLNDDEYLHVKVVLPKKVNKYSGNIGLQFYRRITSFLHKNSIVVNNTYLKFLESQLKGNKAMFLPEQDIYFVIWNLIKFYKIVKDYEIEVTNEYQIFKLC